MDSKKIGMNLRITLYIIIIIALILLKYANIFNFECYIQSKTGIQCPTCGFTRATQSILNLDIKSAINYNAFYTLVLLPIFFILFIQDIYCIIMRKIKQKKCTSFIEIIFSGKYNIIYILIVLIFISFVIWDIFRVISIDNPIF